MDSWIFVLNFVSFLAQFQLRPLGALSVGSCAFLSHLHHCSFCLCVCELTLAFWTYTKLQDHLACLLPHSQNQPGFSKEPGSFHSAVVLETRMRGLGVLVAPGMSSLPGPLCRRSKE